jgi:hypothetical protein
MVLGRDSCGAVKGALGECVSKPATELPEIFANICPWLSQQITEAFPWDTAPRYLLGDRDASYGANFCRRAEAMGIVEVVTAPRSPWQNAYVERVIGSIRRESLDHLVVFNERDLRLAHRLYRRRAGPPQSSLLDERVRSRHAGVTGSSGLREGPSGRTADPSNGS